MASSLPTHVWLIDASIGGHVPKHPPRPGVLLEWRWVPRGPAGWWEGLVLIARDGSGSGRWRVEMQWVPHSELRPAHATPPLPPEY
jgi:hypothetical protein